MTQLIEDIEDAVALNRAIIFGTINAETAAEHFAAQSPEWLAAVADVDIMWRDSPAMVAVMGDGPWWIDQTAVPVGAVEIAALLGVARNTVDQWRQRGGFPAPRWTVGGRPAWDQATVMEWARSTGRAMKKDT